MIRLKNKIFINGFIDALRKLLVQPIPVVQGFKLRKLVKEIEAKREIYEEARLGLLDLHGKKDEAGERIVNDRKVELEDEKAFNEDWVALLEHEENYEADKVKLKDTIELTTADLELLEDIIEI